MFEFCSFMNLPFELIFVENFQIFVFFYSLFFIPLFFLERYKYEAMVEKDTRRQHFQYVGHNHSRDSAIDADLQDLGAETVEISVELVDSHSIYIVDEYLSLVMEIYLL